MTPSDPRYRLIIAGRISDTFATLIYARFGTAVSIDSGSTNATVDLAADQAALRALLTLLWDLGHELVAIRPQHEQQTSHRRPQPCPRPPTDLV